MSPDVSPLRERRQSPLVARKENRATDTFANRVVIPIAEIGLALALLIADVGNPIVIGAKRRARQGRGEMAPLQTLPQCVAGILALVRMVERSVQRSAAWGCGSGRRAETREGARQTCPTVNAPRHGSRVLYVLIRQCCTLSRVPTRPRVVYCVRR